MFEIIAYSENTASQTHSADMRQTKRAKYTLKTKHLSQCSNTVVIIECGSEEHSKCLVGQIFASSFNTITHYCKIK